MTSVLAVFWYFKDRFYGQEDILDGNSTVAYGEYMQVDADHFAIWDKYRREMGLPRNLGYTSIPRGRILFHIPTHHFVVVGSKRIVQNEEAKTAVLSYYGLPSNTEFKTDEHYG